MKKNLLLIILVSVVYTNKTYSQWVQVGSVPASITLPSLSVAKDGSVWIAGGPAGVPEIYKSTDGGQTFLPLNTTGIALDIFCIAALDSLTAFAGDGGGPNGIGGNARMYKTTDGGNTWAEIFQTGGTAGFFNSVTFSKSNPAQGIMQSDPPAGTGTDYYVRITKDSGATWDSIFCPGIPGAISAWHSVFIVDSSFFGFGLTTTPARIYITKDGGQTWNIQNLNIPGAQISGLNFSEDKLRGIAVSNTLPTIAITSDAINWNSLPTGTGIGGAGTCKWITATDLCYLSSSTGSAGCIRRSTDGGQSWATMTTAGINQMIEMDFQVDTSNLVTGYAANISGLVIKIQDSILINPSSVSEITNPSNFYLFPNPVSDLLNVQLLIEESAQVFFELYNFSGQKILCTQPKLMMRGNFSETIDISFLSAGLYSLNSVIGNKVTGSKRFSVNR
ncbi:MAG TPA: T9SS type A sorting domain-containing protein [Bacteroidia bacterium]|nr:T9SS type A sorting domain-containing protein [Bacteroidia bacterium]